MIFMFYVGKGNNDVQKYCKYDNKMRVDWQVVFNYQYSCWLYVIKGSMLICFGVIEIKIEIVINF